MLRRSIAAALGAAALLLPTAAMASTPPPDSGRPTEPDTVSVLPEPAEGLYATEVAMSVDGARTEVARAGVSIDVAVTLQNQSVTTYADASATISETSPGVTVERGTSAIGTIAAQSSAVARFRISIQRDACEDFAGIVFEVDSTPAVPQAVQKVGVPVACPGPRLYLSEIAWSGGDGDGVPEPGETLTLTLGLSNEGGDAATQVRATLTSRTEAVEIVQAASAWPEIPSREARNASTTFLVRIGAGVPEADDCAMLVPEPVVEEPVSDPPPDVDEPVSSDGSNVSSDDPGSVHPGAAGGAGSSPGSAGGGDDATSTTTKDLPAEERRAERPEPSEPVDPAAAFELELAIEAAGDYHTTQHLGTQIYCASHSELGKGDAGAPIDEDARHLAAESTGSTSGGGATGWVGAGLVLVTGMAVLRLSRAS